MSDRPPVSPIHRLRRYRPRPRRRPRYKGPSFNRMIPNLMTMLGLCAGLTAMRFGLEGRFGPAAVAISVAAVIDGLDGRLARMLKATSRFGAEFDSLSDFLCFGVAPPFRVVPVGRCNAAAPMATRRASCSRSAWRCGWRASMPPSMGHRSRLMRTTSSPAFRRPPGRDWRCSRCSSGSRRNRWAGTGLLETAQFPLFCAAMLIGTSVLLVSTLPIWSFKNFKVPSEYVLPLLLGTGAYAAIALADPWGALAAAGLLYLVMVPFSIRSFRRLRREAEAPRDDLDAARRESA